MPSPKLIAIARRLLGLESGPPGRAAVARTRTGTARLGVQRLEDRVVPTVVSLHATAYANAAWGGTNGEAVFTRTGSLAAPLTASYSIGGTAVAGTDYAPLSGTVTFAAGSATANVTIVALPNSTNGSDVLLVLTSGSGYSFGGTQSADVTIVDYPDVVTAYGDAVTTPARAAVTVPVLNDASASLGITLTVTGVTQGAGGSVVLNANGTVTYTPNSGFTGSDSFTYTVADAYGNHSTGTVSVTVTTPAAASTAVWTAANTAVNVAVLSLAAEPGATLTATGVTQGAHGGVVLNADGTATYTPNSGFTGTDSFTFTAADAPGNAATGTVAVLVGTSVPVAPSVAAATAANTAVTVAVLNSAADLNGAALSTSGVTQGAHGGVVLNANGTATYTPNSGFTGTDSFTYTVSDGQGTTATGTVTVTVGPSAPIALAAGAATAPNTAVTVAVAGFVSAAPGDALTVTGVTQGAHGGVVLNANGTATYTPNSGFTGTDSFTYTVTDAFGYASTGTVAVSVAGTPPVDAQSTAVWTRAGAATSVSVLNLASDVIGAALSVSGVTQGAHGGVVLNANGTATYTPNSGFTGTDSFTYTVTDGQGNAATGTVTVTVGASAPVVAGASATTGVGTAITIAVLGLASDPNGDALSVSGVTQGAHGGVALNANGTVTYTPNGGFTGTDTFTYTVTDPYGHATVGTASVAVGSVLPLALSADAATAAGTAVTVAVLAFASAPGALSVSGVTQGAHGSAVLNANGTVTYTPAAGFTGTDTFTYTVTTAGAQTATGTVTVLVGGAAPTAANLQQTQALLAAMTSAVGNPVAAAGTLAALGSAAIGGTGALLGSVPALGNVSITTNPSSTLSELIATYQQDLANFNKMLATEASYWNFLVANKLALDYLKGQIMAALNATQPNVALIQSLQNAWNALAKVQNTVWVEWSLVRLSLGSYRRKLVLEYATIQTAATGNAGRLLLAVPPPPTVPARDRTQITPN